MWYDTFNPLIEVYAGPKGGKILWNDVLQEFFKEIKCVVCAETLLNFPDWIIIFTVHNDAYNKQ